jgi:hypothetical protein
MTTATKDRTCKERVREHLEGRMDDLKKLWAAYGEDSERQIADLGNLNEYGLSFDYVAPGTFEGQRRGYFRYQLSWGGPSDEFRIFTGPGFEIDRIEYWFLDWFDGAKVTLSGKRLDLLSEIFRDFFVESGTAEAVYEKALEA